MHQPEQSQSRPTTPESVLNSSMHRADATIDDLTVALNNFSRLPSPDLPATLVCCCGKEDCENTKAWLSLKTKLESRLILSAEVGQALLQKHEAYMRRYEEMQAQRPLEFRDRGNNDGLSAEVSSDSNIAILLEENLAMRKRLTQTMVDIELTEASNQKLSDELEEARAAISQLTAHHARSVGLEGRLQRVTREMEDIRQERDGETQRAKFAEARINILSERLHNTQAEVRRLQNDLEIQRTHRLESSEVILRSARERLQNLYRSDREKPPPSEEAEVTKVLQSLVGDNERLKKDNEELQLLLSHSRDDLQAVREQLEEQQAQSAPHEAPRSPPYSFHRRQPSHSKLPRSPAHLHSPGRRDAGRISPHLLEPPSPETERRSLSPSDSQTSIDTKWTTSQTRPHVNPEIGDDGQRDTTALTPLAHKPLLLLCQSRGVQTDEWPGLLFSPPMQLDSSSHGDARSEASSMTNESQLTALSSILERVNSLLHRMMQADALSLTNRLKRQQIKGADVRHLSRITVSAIVNEATNLRVQSRSLLEDDKISVSCNRKDLRGLFKIFRELFTEMGDMRVTLNDVILDPSLAAKIRESVLNPTKANSTKHTDGTSTSSGWMAPIAKLFASAQHLTSDVIGSSEQPPPTPSTANQGMPRPPTRVVPKLGPALAASTTTVNVEFSGAGKGKSTTSTASAGSVQANPISSRSSSKPESHASAKVMGIFAGAPHADKWVKVDSQETLRQARLKLKSDRANPPHKAVDDDDMAPKRMSRDVDAVIDPGSPQEGDEANYMAPLLQRTLRRRGLSDSSIHASFTSHADEPKSPVGPLDAHPPREAWASKDSVLWAFGRRVQNFGLGTGGLSSDASSSAPGSDSAPSSPPKPSSISSGRQSQQRQHGDKADNPPVIASPPRRIASPMTFVPSISLSSWAEAAKALDPSLATDADIRAGSWKGDPFAHLPPGRDMHDDYL